jgi:drug/metabolite transporter (DMT)-like permease
VRDKILITLVVLIIILNLGHTADHFARGDFRWPVTVESVPPIIVTLAVNALLCFGLYFYLKKKVGPLFWALAAGTGVALGLGERADLRVGESLCRSVGILALGVVVQHQQR